MATTGARLGVRSTQGACQQGRGKVGERRPKRGKPERAEMRGAGEGEVGVRDETAPSPRLDPSKAGDKDCWD